MKCFLRLALFAIAAAPIIAHASGPQITAVEHCPSLDSIRKNGTLVTSQTASGHQWNGVIDRYSSGDVVRFDQAAAYPFDTDDRVKNKHKSAAAQKDVRQFTGCRYTLEKGSVMLRLDAGGTFPGQVDTIVPTGAGWIKTVGAFGSESQLCTGEPAKCTFRIADTEI